MQLECLVGAYGQSSRSRQHPNNPCKGSFPFTLLSLETCVIGCLGSFPFFSFFSSFNGITRFKNICRVSCVFNASVDVVLFNGINEEQVGRKYFLLEFPYGFDGIPVHNVWNHLLPFLLRNKTFITTVFFPYQGRRSNVHLKLSLSSAVNSSVSLTVPLFICFYYTD